MNVFSESDTAQASRVAERITTKKVHVIACGALAREILAICEASASPISTSTVCRHLAQSSRTHRARLEKAIAEKRAERPWCPHLRCYADCGTGGALDVFCEKAGVERIAGPHCYSFFVGNDAFEARGPTTSAPFSSPIFLRASSRPSSSNRRPRSSSETEGYVFRPLPQADLPRPDRRRGLAAQGEEAARTLGLEYEYRFTGYGDLASDLKRL